MTSLEQPDTQEMEIDPMDGKMLSQITPEIVRESLDQILIQLSLSGLIAVRQHAAVELEQEKRSHG